MSYARKKTMLIHETEYWRLKHRPDSKLPGYLILVSKDEDADSLSDLHPAALAELGLLQARATEALEARLEARLVYVCRWGHQPGYTPHFHIVPLCDWVEEAYAADSRWPEENPDGPVYFTYITRAFIEYNDPPEVKGLSVEDVVKLLRGDFAVKA